MAKVRESELVLVLVTEFQEARYHIDRTVADILLVLRNACRNQ